mmetsp:Transcript_55235/g.131671  ORF Transcript_55235/g.131671 Transcript_55235/m.131671 type:complete len:169 (+) Transcript_55235:46-552(+)
MPRGLCTWSLGGDAFIPEPAGSPIAASDMLLSVPAYGSRAGYAHAVDTFLPSLQPELRHSHVRAATASAFSAAGEGQSHQAEHATEHGIHEVEKLGEEDSETANRARTLIYASVPLSLISGCACAVAAYMEVKCGQYLFQKAALIESSLAQAPSPRSRQRPADGFHTS